MASSDGASHTVPIVDVMSSLLHIVQTGLTKRGPHSVCVRKLTGRSPPSDVSDRRCEPKR
jgi:hypothetical protein